MFCSLLRCFKLDFRKGKCRAKVIYKRVLCSIFNLSPFVILWQYLPYFTKNRLFLLYMDLRWPSLAAAVATLIWAFEGSPFILFPTSREQSMSLWAFCKTYQRIIMKNWKGENLAYYTNTHLHQEVFNKRWASLAQGGWNLFCLFFFYDGHFEC